jgi:hypothetical protein
LLVVFISRLHYSVRKACALIIWNLRNILNARGSVFICQVFSFLQRSTTKIGSEVWQLSCFFFTKTDTNKYRAASSSSLKILKKKISKQTNFLKYRVYPVDHFSKKFDKCCHVRYMRTFTLKEHPWSHVINRFLKKKKLILNQ